MQSGHLACIKDFSNIKVLIRLNDFEIQIQEFIWNCLHHSISGSWKCQCHLMIQMVGLRPIKGIKCSYSILSPPPFYQMNIGFLWKFFNQEDVRKSHYKFPLGVKNFKVIKGIYKRFKGIHRKNWGVKDTGEKRFRSLGFISPIYQNE